MCSFCQKNHNLPQYEVINNKKSKKSFLQNEKKLEFEGVLYRAAEGPMDLKLLSVASFATTSTSSDEAVDV